jgi:adenine-specific DNA-methyltransferase
MTQQTDLKHIESQSMDLTEHNIEQLKLLFPNVFTEGKIDFDALKSELGEFADTDNERYQFTWNGKEQAKRMATTPTLGTLRPAPEESVNWDTTENLYLEGDNLEVLKLLQKSYFGKVKMIHIDPPYNTGKDFIYKDDFKDNLANYQRLTGQKNQEGNPLFTNSDSSGRYHSNWLNMMYPRLKVARNLLRDDGVIFISIDDNEITNLKKICDEIFGEFNFVSVFIWEKKYTTSNNIAGVSDVHEYVVCYVKNKQLLANAISRLPYSDEALARYKNPDNDPRGPWMDASYHGPKSPSERPNLNYPINHPKTGEEIWPIEKSWAYEYKNYELHLAENRLWWGSKLTYKEPRIKKFLSEIQGGLVPRSLLTYKDVGGTSNGRDNLRSIFGNSQGAIFDNPKPIKLINKLLQIGSHESEIILDFFSGSSTTAHAVMQMNSEDNGSRKFIMVQIPEATPEKSEAQQAGYETIPEIGKERIRRAAKKIKEEHPETQADLGFKVFKLDTSNIKKWQPNMDDLETDLLSAVNNILPDRNSQDLLFEVLIKYGLPLTLPVEQINIQSNGQTYQTWNVANNALIACFDENLTLETIQSIAALSTPENPILRVVFRDSSFIDDITKTTAIQRLKQSGIEDVLSI